MPEVNEAIIRMLQEYPDDVAQVATRALRLAADQLPPAGVAEQMEAAIRRAVRSSEKEA